MRRPLVAFRFDARDGVFANLFLARVAQRLAAAPAGSGLLVERRPPAVDATLVTEPALARALARCRDGLPGTIASVDRSKPGTEAVPSGFAFLTAVGTEGAHERDDVSDTEPAGPARLAMASTPPTWVQSHWFADGAGRLRVWTRIALAPSEPLDLAPALALAERLRAASGAPVGLVVRRPHAWRRREWRRGELARLRAGPPLLLAPAAASALFPEAGGEGTGEPPPVATVVLGASGSGKTSYLAALAAGRIGAGDRVVAIDVHGDLAPAIVARLAPAARARVVAIDAAAPLDQLVGIDVLGAAEDVTSARGPEDLVAALERLSGDGAERRWGFRLERLLDAFVRLALEEEGTLVDVAELLTDDRRREAARLATRSPELARFLDEVVGLLRRNPEYLQSAAARVRRVLADPRLALLVAPPDGGIPAAELLAAGSSILLRLPFPVLGPAAAEYAASLLATRLYLTLVRRGTAGAPAKRTWFVVDEAHLLAPRLLVEAVTDGRKFGIVAVVASQYPERLAPELRAAVAGAAGVHLLFRTPAAAARTSGAWVGLAAVESASVLPSLPPGVAVAARAGAPPRFLSIPPLRPAREPWTACVARTSARWALGTELEAGERELEEALWSVLNGPPSGAIGPAASGAVSHDDGISHEILRELARRGYLTSEAPPVVSPAGRRYLGLDRATGATSESAEHRRLLYEAQRIFALHQERLEVVRQGRFDARLPDGRLVLEIARAASPSERLEQLEQRRATWAWRCFGGRDVHVEAEVTGADRPERIRRGLAKARARGAAVVFVVGDPRRARRVRAQLGRAGARPPEAYVWTIPEWRSAAAPRT